MSTIIEEILNLIHANSFYRKSIETFETNSSIDQSVFHQLQICLSKLEFLSLDIDYLSPLILFLLEHRPLEIDLNLLTSTDTNFQQQTSTRKFYKPKLISFVQHSSASNQLLQQLCQLFQRTKLDELLLLKHNTQPLYFHCLEHLRPLLSKTTYDKYPLAIQIFIHLIQSMSQSALAESFDGIFPVCLMTLDDPSIEMKFLSLCLIDYLQRNSTTTDLLLFNRANVIM